MNDQRSKMLIMKRKTHVRNSVSHSVSEQTNVTSCPIICKITNSMDEYEREMLTFYYFVPFSLRIINFVFDEEVKWSDGRTVSNFQGYFMPEK